MQVHECMSLNAAAGLPRISCEATGDIMRRRRCGFVSIIDGPRTKRVVGVVTDRDIMLCLVRLNQSPSRVAVEKCMAKSPSTISSESDLADAVRIMKQAAVRQLPVIENGRLVGVLSLEDIALAIRRQWAYVGPQITQHSVMEIMEAIAVARERRKAGARG